ncbi:unnamed protein product [Heterosigma akashiwo]
MELSELLRLLDEQGGVVVDFSSYQGKKLLNGTNIQLDGKVLFKLHVVCSTDLLQLMKWSGQRGPNYQWPIFCARVASDVLKNPCFDLNDETYLDLSKRREKFQKVGDGVVA